MFTTSASASTSENFPNSALTSIFDLRIADCRLPIANLGRGVRVVYIPNPQSAIGNQQLPAPFFDHCARFTIGFALFFGLALVVKLLSLGDGKLDLDASILQIHFSRNKRETLLLNFAGELVDFRPMQQQLSRARWLVVLSIAVTVRAYVHIHQPGFLLAYLRIAVFKVAASLASRFHFCTGQRDATFVSLEYMEVVVGLSIGCHHFVSTHKKEECGLKRQQASTRVAQEYIRCFDYTQRDRRTNHEKTRTQTRVYATAAWRVDRTIS